MSLTKRDLMLIKEVVDTSFEEKFGPAFDKAFERSFHPAFEKAFERAFQPAFEKAFEGVFQPAFDKAFERAFQPAFEKAFDKAFNRAFYEHMEPIMLAINERFDHIDEELAKRPTMQKIMEWSDNRIAELETDRNKCKYIHREEWSELPDAGKINQALIAKGIR